MMILVGGAVLTATVISLIPVDADKCLQDALAAYEARDTKGFEAAFKTLKTVPGYEKEVELLEGLDLLISSRPLKAAPVLASAAEKKEIRTIALSYQAQALARAEKRLDAVKVLETAISEDPDAALPHGILGGVFYELGAFELALPELKTMSEGDKLPEAAAAHNIRGAILKDLDRYQEAAE